MHRLIQTKCDKCGQMVETYYTHNDWFAKYLKEEEDKICLNCIKGRKGFRAEFKRMIGISVEDLLGYK